MHIDMRISNLDLLIDAYLALRPSFKQFYASPPTYLKSFSKFCAFGKPFVSLQVPPRRNKTYTDIHSSL